MSSSFIADDDLSGERLNGSISLSRRAFLMIDLSTKHLEEGSITGSESIFR